MTSLKPSARKQIRDYGIAVAIAVIVAVAIRFFAIEAYRIPSAAMRPALEPGDTIFVSKSTYGMRLPFSDPTKGPFRPGKSPERGEVVVYSLPENPRKEFIKRVIAVAGDRVEIRKGRAVLNEKPIQTGPGKSDPSCVTEALPGGREFEACFDPPVVEDFGPETVPQGSVFVIGDMRTQGAIETKKQRNWGIIPISMLKGKAVSVWLSIEPRELGDSGFVPRFRFDRMFRSIE